MVTNLRLNDSKFLQVILLAAKGGLGVSSVRLLALPAFLASAVGAKATSNEFLGLEQKNGTDSEALEFLFELAKCELTQEM